jgi:hypothetical protein
MEHNTDQFYGTQYRSVLWNTIPISFMEHNTDQFYGTQYRSVLWNTIPISFMEHNTHQFYGFCTQKDKTIRNIVLVKQK